MIRTIFFPTPAAQSQPQYDINAEALHDAIHQPDALLWVCLENPDENEVKTLSEVFHFHPLAIEDTQSEGYQPPKIDDFGSYLFLVVHGIVTDPNVSSLGTQELNLFLGENYLVSVYHGQKSQAVETVFTRIKRDERLYSFGSDYLCHALLDALVDEYIPVIDQMDEEIEVLEDLVLARPSPKTLERILSLKHSIMAMRRIISPMREVMNRLSRDDFPMIDQQSRIYYRDIYDHLVRIQDMSESIRDIVSGTMDIYLNSTSLRLNEIMRALTVVSTIFLPLSFLAGVYGTNFSETFPHYSNPYGFLILWVVCILIVVGMLTWFRKRNWF